MSISQKVSIVVPIYNGGLFLQETIHSLVSGTYKNIEIILIDDCSTDNSREMIKKYENNPLFKIIYNEYNMGLNLNIHKGIESATGEYICLCGQDDLYPKDKIEKELKYLIDNGYDVVYGSNELINDKSEIIPNSSPNTEEFIKLLKEDKKKLLEIISTAPPKHWLPMSQSAIYKAYVLKELNTFRKTVSLDDWPILVKTFENYNFGFIDEVMFYWRIHENNNHKNLWWNFGISIQSCVLCVKEEYKFAILANNFYYTANTFYSRKKWLSAFKFYLISFILKPDSFRLKKNLEIYKKVLEIW